MVQLNDELAANGGVGAVGPWSAIAGESGAEHATSDKRVTEGTRCSVVGHCDYLSVVLSYPRSSNDLSFEVVRAAVAETLFGEWNPLLFRRLEGVAGKTYQRVFHGPGTCRLEEEMWPQRGTELCHVRVELKGEYFESGDLRNCEALFNWCRRNGVKFKPTRIDYAWDDCPFSVKDDVIPALEGKDLRTRAKKRQYWLGGEWVGDVKSEGNTGTVGSRQTERSLCIYDRRGPVRCEFRLRDRRAQCVMQEFLYDIEDGKASDWEEAARVSMMRHLVAFVEFSPNGREVRKSGHGRSSWWRAFVGSVVRSPLLIRRKLKSIEKSMAFLEAKMAPTFALVHHALLRSGESAAEWLEKLLFAGSERLSAWQEYALRSVSAGDLSSSGNDLQGDRQAAMMGG